MIASVPFIDLPPNIIFTNADTIRHTHDPVSSGSAPTESVISGIVPTFSPTLSSLPLAQYSLCHPQSLSNEIPLNPAPQFHYFESPFHRLTPIPHRQNLLLGSYTLVVRLQ